VAAAVYFLCALTSAACAMLLFRSYRRSRVRLLFWSTLCFVFLALNNTFLFVDLVVVPEIDLSLLRNLLAVAGLVTLLFALVWDAR
jgi:hypothetical protein